MDIVRNKHIHNALLTSILLAGCFGLQFFGDFHSYQNADSLVYSIMSYHQPTLYFWGQDRLLALLPALLSPIKNPEANLVAMAACMLAMAFTLPFLVAALLDIRHRTLFGFVVLGCLALFKAFFWIELCVVPYTQSFFLLVLSLLACKRAFATEQEDSRAGWALLGSILILAAYNVAQPAMAVFIVWLSWLAVRALKISVDADSAHLQLDSARRVTRSFVMIAGFSVVLFLAFAAIQLSATSHGDALWTNLAVTINMHAIVHGVLACSMSAIGAYGKNPALIVFVTWLVIASYGVLAAHGRFDRIGASIILFLVPAAIIAVTLASLAFVKENHYHGRYYCDPILLLAMNAAYLAVCVGEYVPRWDRVRPVLITLMAIVVIVTLASDFHVGRYESPVDRIAANVPYAQELRGIEGVDGIVGEYWRIWPCVWLENAWGRRDFLGVGQRTGYHYRALLHDGAGRKPIRLVGYVDDPDAEEYSVRCFNRVVALEPVSSHFRVLSVVPGPGGFEPLETFMNRGQRVVLINQRL
ncbi:MAG: hypothetical protein P4L33_03925 [Capsulimonadaceae bacterium]|nr:hypothetical protein [Capsulimonadaceae bacterium]